MTKPAAPIAARNGPISTPSCESATTKPMNPDDLPRRVDDEGAQQIAALLHHPQCASHDAADERGHEPERDQDADELEDVEQQRDPAFGAAEPEPCGGACLGEERPEISALDVLGQRLDVGARIGDIAALAFERRDDGSTREIKVARSLRSAAIRASNRAVSSAPAL